MRDDEILGLLREDPEKGIKALTARYGGLVYAVVRRNLGGAAEADIEACAADVFAEFYLELDKYDPSKGSLKAWLCVIARHNALDAAREIKETLPLDEEIISEESSVESELENAELRRAVLDEVKSLPGARPRDSPAEVLSRGKLEGDRPAVKNVCFKRRHANVPRR